MDIDDWLNDALADADRRGLPELRSLLEMLASATRVLRAADWNPSPADQPPAPPDDDARPAEVSQ